MIILNLWHGVHGKYHGNNLKYDGSVLAYDWELYDFNRLLLYDHVWDETVMMECSGNNS